MTKLRLGTSYWIDAFNGRPLRCPTFRGHREVDVAIIGGGVTGCATAYFFARAGARVALIERARIGRGSTAASTALLMQEPDVDFSDLAERYGFGVAKRIWMRSRAAVADVRRTLQALRPAVAFENLPSVYFARDVAGARALRREHAMRRRAGLPGRLLSHGGACKAAGFDAAGALWTPGNAQVDPYRACLALARQARREGAELFERSAARSVKGTKTGVSVELEGGDIRASWAVIATGYATPEFKPIAGRFRMMNTYVIATPRLSTSVRRIAGPSDVMLWDTERPYHYARWTPDHRLLFGGADRPQSPQATRPAWLRQRADALQQQLWSLYPALRGLRPEYAWEGLFATTPDGLPYIGLHRRYPRQLFALGYGGNGMTFGFLAARTLVGLARGHAGPDAALFGFARRKL